MSLTDIKRYLALLPQNDINVICQPLHKNFEINFFAYVRVYKDGSRVHLTNKPDCTSWVYETKCSVVGAVGAVCKEGIYTGKHLECDMSPQQRAKNSFQLHGTINYFDFDTIDHGINLVKKSQNYTEVFDFAASPHSNLSTSFYVNNVDILEHFILYFKEKAEKIILHADNNRIASPDPIDSETQLIKSINDSIAANTKEAFFAATKLTKVISDSNNEKGHLTENELRYLALLLAGCNIKEISKFLRVSPKKAREDIDKIKRKFSSNPPPMTIFKNVLK